MSLTLTPPGLGPERPTSPLISVLLRRTLDIERPETVLGRIPVVEADPSLRCSQADILPKGVEKQK